MKVQLLFFARLVATCLSPERLGLRCFYYGRLERCDSAARSLHLIQSKLTETLISKLFFERISPILISNFNS
jgi:hypothetical protein